MMNHFDPHHRPRRGAGLALIGYRGTGKSTVGRMLADRLGRPFRDADIEIEARAGRSISSIFSECGEPAFRDWEERTLVELTLSFPDAILATGGGAILRPSNRVFWQGSVSSSGCAPSPPSSRGESRATRPRLPHAPR